jgi:hypothetical protein
VCHLIETSEWKGCWDGNVLAWISYCISSSVGDPDPQDPHVFLALPNPDPFVRGTDPAPALDPSLFS